MGDHRNNPIALIHQAPKPRPVEYGYQHAFEVSIEPNKVKMAEITKMLDEAKAAGKQPNEIDLNIPITPEEQDYVAYHQVLQLRPTSLMNQQGQRQMMMAKIRGAEAFRMPFAEVLARAQQAADGGPSDTKA